MVTCLKKKKKKERLILVLELVALVRLTISVLGNLHVQVEAEFDELSFILFHLKKSAISFIPTLMSCEPLILVPLFFSVWKVKERVIL